jgi:hypothetical protein
LLHQPGVVDGKIFTFQFSQLPIIAKENNQRDSPRQAEIEAGAVTILAPDAGLRMPVF